MYHLPRLNEIANPIVLPDCMITLPNLCEFSCKVDPYSVLLPENNYNHLFNKQEEVICKSKALNTKLSNLINSDMDPKSIELLGIQEEIINRLKKVQNEIINAAAKKGITMKSSFKDTSSESCELMEKQIHINQRLETLKKKIYDYSESKGFNLLESIDMLKWKQASVLKRSSDLKNELTQLMSKSGCKKSSTNISIFADPSDPPISIFIFLTFLRDCGYSVTCIDYSYKGQHETCPLIHEFIKDNLFINNERRDTYNLIVSVIWRPVELVGCITHHDVFNSVPMYGELMALNLIGQHFGSGFDGMCEKLSQLEKALFVNLDLKHAQGIVEKLMKSSGSNECLNKMIQSFIYSCLFKSVDCLCEKSVKLKQALDNLQGLLNVNFMKEH